MKGTSPSGTWCVQLNGHEMDLEAWSQELAFPFDPWIEKVSHAGNGVHLLRNSAFIAATGGSEAQAIGRSLLDRLQGAFQITSGQTAEISLGASVLIDPAGALRFHYFLETMSWCVIGWDRPLSQSGTQAERSFRHPHPNRHPLSSGSALRQAMTIGVTYSFTSEEPTTGSIFSKHLRSQGG